MKTAAAAARVGQQWYLSLKALAGGTGNWNEARELAALLEETLPDLRWLQADHGERNASVRAIAPSQLRRPLSFRDRLATGVPIPIDERSIDWGLLTAVVSTELLKDDEAGSVQVEVNSGGRVFFCFFSSAAPGQPEGVAVLKFGPSRLLMQAEQFANELTRHLDICAPDCRIVRQAGASSEEWRALSEACAALGGGGGCAADLATELTSLPVVLLMEYAPGWPLLECKEAFQSPGPMLSTLEGLGRLFLLDLVLGNADRLPCADLAWRGNPNNILFGRPGSHYCSRIVAIDSCVQRRPPAARLSVEDAGVDRLAQLLLTDQDVVLDLLRSVLVRSPAGLAALAASPGGAAEAFQRGFRECLGLVERIKGLLEMMHSKMHEWSLEFISDVKALRPELPIPNPAAAALGPGAAHGGGGGGGRVVARYTGLNIRVSPGPGAGPSGGAGRNRVAAAVRAGGTGSGAASSSGSPARPLRTSPYLATATGARPQTRSRNAPAGGGSPAPATGAASPAPPAPHRAGTDPSQAAVGAPSSATASAAPPSPAASRFGVAQSPPRLRVRTSGGGDGGSASVAPAHPAPAAAALGVSPARAAAPVHAGFGISMEPPLQHCMSGGPAGGADGRDGAGSNGPPRLDAVYGNVYGSHAGGGAGGGRWPSVAQQQRRGSALGAPAPPGWPSSSPYAPAAAAPGGGGGGGGLSDSVLRRRSFSCNAGRRAPVKPDGSPARIARSASGSHGTAASHPHGAGLAGASPQATPPGSQPGPHRTPRTGDGAARYGSPHLPPVALTPHAAGSAGRGSGGGGGGAAAATATFAAWASPAARTPSGPGPSTGQEREGGGGGLDAPPSAFAAPGTAAAANISPSGPPPASAFAAPGAAAAAHVSPSGTPLYLRAPSGIAQLGIGDGGAAGGGRQPPGLRPSRSFGMLRSPRFGGRQGSSPRKNISPASPRFRSPLLLPLGGHDDAAVLYGAAGHPHPLTSASSAPGHAQGAPGPGVHPQPQAHFPHPHPLPHLLYEPSYGAAAGVAGADGGAAAPRWSHLQPLAPDQQLQPSRSGSALQPPCYASKPPPVVAAAAAGGASSAAKPPLPRAGSARLTPPPANRAAPGAARPARPPQPHSTAAAPQGQPGPSAVAHPPPPAAAGPSPISPPAARDSCASPVSPAGSLSHYHRPQVPASASTPPGSGSTTSGSARSSPSASPFSFHTAAPPPPGSPSATPPPHHAPMGGGAAALRTPSPLAPHHAPGSAPAQHSAASGPASAPRPAPGRPDTSSHTPPARGIPSRAPHGTAAGTAADTAAAPTSAASPGSAGGSGASRAPTAAAGRAGSNGPGGGGGGQGRHASARRTSAARGTPGAGVDAGVTAAILRASPNHASPYDQLKSDISLTMAFKSISNEARKDDLLSGRVQHWKELFRARGEELKAAVGEWQSRHQLERVLTTGFLDGTHPVVDTYELKIRLEHMLRRLQVLQEAAAAQKPNCVLEPPFGLFVGGAVSADSHHILRHLRITHIVNATEELLLPDPRSGFIVLRVPLRDVDDEDIGTHFEAVSEFIQSCHAASGSVLVHCSEGKSRSVTLVLAYLMRVKGWRLKAAFEHVKACRPVACPNAGFTSRLLAYERDLFGSTSHIPQQLKKAKPDPIICPTCGAAVGVSSASLAVHMKRAHPPPAPAHVGERSGSEAGGSAGGAEPAPAHGQERGTRAAHARAVARRAQHQEQQAQQHEEQQAQQERPQHQPSAGGEQVAVEHGGAAQKA